MDSWSIQFGKIDMSTKGTDTYSKLRQFLENRFLDQTKCTRLSQNIKNVFYIFYHLKYYMLSLFEIFLRL